MLLNKDFQDMSGDLQVQFFYRMLASRTLDLVCLHSRLILGQTLNYKPAIYPG